MVFIKKHIDNIFYGVAYLKMAHSVFIKKESVI